MQEKITTNAIFISRLIEVSTRLNVSQSELGRRCNISQSAISAYMNGKRNPGADELGRIASVGGVSMDWLWGLIDKNETPDEKMLKINKLAQKIDATKKELLHIFNSLDQI